jgi:hypothetical protein
MAPVGKTGRSEVSPHDRRTLWFARYAAGAPGYTAPPPADDWTGDWLNDLYTYLGNDRVGCCTRTCYGHIVQQRSALINEPCKLTESDVLKAYADGTGWDGTATTDHGDSIIDALVQMKNVGLGTYKISQFGRVNYKDPIEMRAALNIFGSLIVGADLPESIKREGNTWDVSPIGSRQADEKPGSYGGHAFIITGHQRGNWWAMPWINKTGLTYAWEDLYIDEAWFVIDDLWVTANRNAPNGFDLERIRHDAAAIAAL